MTVMELRFQYYNGLHRSWKLDIVLLPYFIFNYILDCSPIHNFKI